MSELWTGWTDVGGLRLHDRRGGTELAARPAVLVHGIGVSGRYLLPLARVLSRRRPTYVPDLPGFGRSESPPEALGVPGLAAALGRWLDAAAVERPLLVANSMGCQVVADLVVRRPGRAAALLLVGPTVDASARSWAGQAVRLVADSVREPVSLLPIIAADYARYGLLRFVRTAASALDDRLELDLPRIDVPALVVRGERDALVPRGWGQRVAELLPRGRLVELTGEAHACHYSAPGLVASLVEGLAQEVEHEAGERVGRLPHGDVRRAGHERHPGVR